MQYHWTCYQSPWNDVELVTIRWFPSHHILHPANILENYQSMSSLPSFLQKKTRPTQQRSVLLAMPSNPQSPHPPSPFQRKRYNFHPPTPTNHSHHQHRGTFAFQQFVLQIRRSIIRFDHLFGTLPQPWVWCTGDQVQGLIEGWEEGMYWYRLYIFKSGWFGYRYRYTNMDVIVLRRVYLLECSLRPSFPLSFLSNCAMFYSKFKMAPKQKIAGTARMLRGGRETHPQPSSAPRDRYII